MENLTVDCATCTARDIGCGDCVISVLLGFPEVGAPTRVELDGDERAALDALALSGLVPPLRLVEGEGRPDATRRRA
ncbi:hypothetical protein [Mariniluteicoccus flavus]